MLGGREQVGGRGGVDVGGPPDKRARMAAPLMGGGGAGRPSKVVTVRSLPDNVAEPDLLDACAQWGNVAYVNLTGRGTALVEFELQASAEECVNYNASTDVFVLQTPVYFDFASMDSIPRRGMESAVPSPVLLMYVNNARYPISTDVVAAILKPIAPPNRMVIARRQGVQVLVEFADAETARTVKQRLNGCDIYSGCCTLKIDYAQLTRLNVSRNDQDQWDYVGGAGRGGIAQDGRPSLLNEPPAFPGPAPPFGVVPGGPMPGGPDEIGYDGAGRPIYDDPYSGFGNAAMMSSSGGPMGMPAGVGGGMMAMGGGGANYYGGAPSGQPAPMMAGHGAPILDFSHGGGGGWGRDDLYERGGGGGGGRYEFERMDAYRGRRSPDPYNGGGGGGGMRGRSRSPPYAGGGGGGPVGAADGTGAGGYDNSVIMIYGLADSFNCDRLFNLLCLYGNVVRMKFLRSKTDSAMVQMGDPIAAERVLRNLNRVMVFGKELQLSMSKKPQLEDMRTEPYPLPDGSPSYKDYRESRSNRFLTPGGAAKNRLNPPGTNVYFFNVPTDFTDAQLQEILEKEHLPRASRTTVFEPRENSRSCAGVAEFENPADATEAVVKLNHYPIESATSRSPFLIKMTFSGPHGRGGDFRGGGRGGRGGGADFRGRDEERINGPQHVVADRIRRDGRGGGRGRGRGRGSPRDRSPPSRRYRD